MDTTTTRAQHHQHVQGKNVDGNLSSDAMRSYSAMSRSFDDDNTGWFFLGDDDGLPAELIVQFLLLRCAIVVLLYLFLSTTTTTNDTRKSTPIHVWMLLNFSTNDGQSSTVGVVVSTENPSTLL